MEVEGATCCRELLGNSRPNCLCPPPSALATGFVFRKHTDQGRRGEMSELAAGSPVRPSLPQLCPRVTFSIRKGTQNVCGEGSSVAFWASRLGAAGL